MVLKNGACDLHRVLDMSRYEHEPQMERKKQEVLRTFLAFSVENRVLRCFRRLQGYSGGGGELTQLWLYG